MMAKIKQAKTVMGVMRGKPVNVNQILQQNPQVMQAINMYGDANKAISAICQQNGIDYQEFMDAIK